MLKNILNLTGVVQLNREQQKSINGGGTYSCFCGFVAGEWEDFKVLVEADSVGDALNSMNCGGLGATCEGVGFH